MPHSVWSLDFGNHLRCVSNYDTSRETDNELKRLSRDLSLAESYGDVVILIGQNQWDRQLTRVPELVSHFRQAKMRIQRSKAFAAVGVFGDSPFAWRSGPSRRALHAVLRKLPSCSGFKVEEESDSKSPEQPAADLYDLHAAENDVYANADDAVSRLDSTDSHHSSHQVLLPPEFTVFIDGIDGGMKWSELRFKLTVQSASNTRTTVRSYKDFCDLATVLKRKFPLFPFMDIPQLGTFDIWAKPAQLDFRQLLLEHFVQDLALNRWMSKQAPLLEFLGWLDPPLPEAGVPVSPSTGLVRIVSGTWAYLKSFTGAEADAVVPSADSIDVARPRTSAAKSGAGTAYATAAELRNVTLRRRRVDAAVTNDASQRPAAPETRASAVKARSHPASPPGRASIRTRVKDAWKPAECIRAYKALPTRSPPPAPLSPHPHPHPIPSFPLVTIRTSFYPDSPVASCKAAWQAKMSGHLQLVEGQRIWLLPSRGHLRFGRTCADATVRPPAS